MISTNSSHIIIINKEGKFLLLKRSPNDEWCPNLWSIPGGRREEGETLFQNICREVKEETGLTVFPKFIRFLSEISEKLDHIFFATNKFEGKVSLDKENSEWNWFSLKNLIDKECVPNLREEIKEGLRIMSEKIKIVVSESQSSNKVGLKGSHKGLDYNDMTSDRFDGPRKPSDRRNAKRMASKTQRRKAKSDIATQMSQHTDEVDEDLLPGGIGDSVKPTDFNVYSILNGLKVEMEHTDDLDIALEIVLDHLTEDKDYYTKLKQVER